MLLLVKDRQQHSVRITVITTEPHEVTYGRTDGCRELSSGMRQAGADVVTKAEVEEYFAVIDYE